MGKIMIRDFKDKQPIESSFLVRDKILNAGKTGKSYLALQLSDASGTIEARIWEQAEFWDSEFEADDFLHIKGYVQAFQGRLQLVVQNLQAMDRSEINLADFLPCSKRNPDEMFAELNEILKKIKNPFISKLVFSTLEDPAIQPLFKMAPAAKSIHHAYMSGLLEHVLSISNLMVKIQSHYTRMDLDLLLFGAVFHDIGKIWELKFETSFGYTDVGRLVGHIPLGSELVEKKASLIPNFPFDLKNILKHIVLSHHGRLDYGSPKRPKFIEAFVVAYVDDFDSKINQLENLYDAEKTGRGEKWSRMNSLFERHFLLELPHRGQTPNSTSTETNL